MTQPPGAPGIDADDQQVPAGTHATRCFTQQAVWRKAEIQRVLQDHHVGGMLAERPGLFLAVDFHTRQRCTEANATFDVLRLHRFAGKWAVVHQIAAEATGQLVGQDLLFLY